LEIVGTILRVDPQFVTDPGNSRFVYRFKHQ
jgi:hypothetical protein